MSAPKIIVVGSFNYDLTFTCEEFPLPGQTVLGDFRVGPGGKGSNQAVAAARTGVSTGFIGAVGKDRFGGEARDLLAREGIHAHLYEIEDTPTGTAAVILNRERENEIIVAAGANARLPEDAIPEAFWESAACVVCQCETNLNAVAAILRKARERNVRTILNPAPLPRDFDLEILDSCDILVPNETEFAGLVRRRSTSSTRHYFDEERIATLSSNELHHLCREIGPDIVVLTLGARGAVLSTDADFRVVPTRLGMNVVDTVGAGDAFVGGLASGLVRFSGDIQQSVSYANTVAALAVTRAGAAEGMPHSDEIDALWSGR